jgi:hypothetical protein
MAAKKNSSQQPDSIMTTPKAVCINFCSYYKPEKAEDLACQSFTVIKRLMEEGRRISLKKEAAAVHPGVSELLSRKICAACSFREDGCDFAAGQKGVPPCGGFLLLSRLIGSRLLHVDDI